MSTKNIKGAKYDCKFWVIKSEQKRGVKGTIKKELKRRSVVGRNCIQLPLATSAAAIFPRNMEMAIVDVIEKWRMCFSRIRDTVRMGFYGFNGLLNTEREMLALRHPECF